jgi:hypothetical protein
VDLSAGHHKLESLDGEQRSALRAILSLIYFSDAQGKQILESLCRSLDRTGTNELPLGDAAHSFFVHQVDDETKHAEGILLLFDRLGLKPEDRTLSHVLYSKVLLADGLFDAKIILIYWYIEIFAKGIFVELRRKFPDTCIDSLFTRIIRDEAKHVGFGEIFIPEHAAAPAQAASSTQTSLAYYSSAAILPILYRFGHYARAARVLDLDLSTMFRDGMRDVSAKALKLPGDKRLLDLSRPASWLAMLL